MILRRDDRQEREKLNIYVKYIKRSIDFILSGSMLILLSPVFVITAVFVFFDNGCPIIYKQKRVGQDGNEFIIYKFRTMVKDAEKKGGASTAQNDQRITRMGRILRKISLDELPQLMNIFKGNMSLIGYRPDVRRDGIDYTSKKYLLKPGITGNAQVNGRSSLTADEKRKLEEEYVLKVSFLMDLKIIFKTIQVVFKRDNSN